MWPSCYPLPKLCLASLAKKNVPHIGRLPDDVGSVEDSQITMEDMDDDDGDEILDMCLSPLGINCTQEDCLKD